MKLLSAVSAVSGLFQRRYRPEAHYMRGPGPACAAKRQAHEGASEAPVSREDTRQTRRKGDAPAH